MYWSRPQVAGDAPEGLRAHTTTVVGSKLYVLGGCAEECYNTIYIFDTENFTWSNPEATGDVPIPFRAHTTTLIGSNLFVFGGGDGPTYFDSLYVLDTNTLNWSRPETKGDVPGPRRAHTACVHGSDMVIFGGGDGGRALNETYALDTTTMTWRKLECTGDIPRARGYHTTTLMDDELAVFGGSDGHDCFQSIHCLDLKTLVWRELPIRGELTLCRLSHTATRVGHYIFMIGGHDGTTYTSEIAAFNMRSLRWEEMFSTGAVPIARGYHTACLHDSKIYVFGGYDGESVFSDLTILDLGVMAGFPSIAETKRLEGGAGPASGAGVGSATPALLARCNELYASIVRLDAITAAIDTSTTKGWFADAQTNTNIKPLKPLSLDDLCSVSGFNTVFGTADDNTSGEALADYLESELSAAKVVAARAASSAASRRRAIAEFDGAKPSHSLATIANAVCAPALAVVSSTTTTSTSTAVATLLYAEKVAREWDTKTDSNPWGLVLETADQAAALRAHNADLEATYAPRMAAARQRLDLTLAAMFRKREDVVGLAAGIDALFAYPPIASLDVYSPGTAAFESEMSRTSAVCAANALARSYVMKEQFPERLNLLSLKQREAERNAAKRELTGRRNNNSKKRDRKGRKSKFESHMEYGGSSLPSINDLESVQEAIAAMSDDEDDEVAAEEQREAIRRSVRFSEPVESGATPEGGAPDEEFDEGPLTAAQKRKALKRERKAADKARKAARAAADSLSKPVGAAEQADGDSEESSENGESEGSGSNEIDDVREEEPVVRRPKKLSKREIRQQKKEAKRAAAAAAAAEALAAKAAEEAKESDKANVDNNDSTGVDTINEGGATQGNSNDGVSEDVAAAAAAADEAAVVVDNTATVGLGPVPTQQGKKAKRKKGRNARLVVNV